MGFEYSDLLGKRYEDYADGPDRFNCWGIIRECHRRCGIELPDLNSVYRIHGAQPSRDALSAVILREASDGWETVETPAFGVVALLRVLKRPTHMGFMIDRSRFLHVLQDPTMPGGSDVVVVHRLDSPQWEHKLESFHRWKTFE